MGMKKKKKKKKTSFEPKLSCVSRLLTEEPLTMRTLAILVIPAAGNVDGPTVLVAQLRVVGVIVGFVGSPVEILGFFQRAGPHVATLAHKVVQTHPHLGH